jgi:hypothetical protein
VGWVLQEWVGPCKSGLVPLECLSQRVKSGPSLFSCFAHVPLLHIAGFHTCCGAATPLLSGCGAILFRLLRHQDHGPNKSIFFFFHFLYKAYSVRYFVIATQNEPIHPERLSPCWRVRVISMAPLNIYLCWSELWTSPVDGKPSFLTMPLHPSGGAVCASLQSIRACLE